MKSLFFWIILVSPLFLNAADPSFVPQDVSQENQLLFTAFVDEPGWSIYSTALMADLENENRLDIFTYFPENTAYFQETGELEILNRFGLFRGKIDGESEFQALEFHPAFTTGTPLYKGVVLPISSSPDGRWIIVQEPKTSVRGNLVLYEVRTRKPYVISSDHILDYRKKPALWSPDSRCFLYSFESHLYYLTIDHLEQSPVPDESYRVFGTGTLDSIHWVGNNNLYYLSDSIVSNVHPTEFFTRSFYADPVPLGQISGRIPIFFDPQFDQFWPAPDGQSIMVFKNGQTLFHFPLSLERSNADSKALILPVLILPQGMTILQLSWGLDGNVTVLTGGKRDDGTDSVFYQIKTQAHTNASFQYRSLENLKHIRGYAASPDGQRIAILGESGISIRLSDTFSEQKFIHHPDPRKVFWTSNHKILVAGGQRSEWINLIDGSRTLITLSSVQQFGFNESGGIGAANSDHIYQWDAQKSKWIESREKIRAPQLESPSYHVFSESLISSSYTNTIMVRSMEGFGNYTIFPTPKIAPLSFDSDAEQFRDPVIDSHVFNHGSRTWGRQVSLVFNAVGSDDGLSDVMRILAEYNIQTTFFVCGDFIRRYPESTRILAESAHSIGNLFYTHMNMMDYHYMIDEDFIVRGLGHNEDAFFQATGSEISTLWHAPWYVITPAIIDATVRMNYTYIGRDIDPLDWVSLGSSLELRNLYKPSAVLVEKVLEDVRPGSIIPIRIGRSGEREDYFFQRLDLLIIGLWKQGYEIVPISELEENSQR